MAYQGRYENQSKRIVQSSMTTTTTKTTSFRSQRSSLERSEVKMEIKGPTFGSHDIKMVSREEHSSMTESRQWKSGTSRGIGNYSSFNQQSLVSDMIGGGKAITEGRRGVGHSTTSHGHGDESPVVVVQKERPQFETPEWMEERLTPETKRRNPEVLDINIFLKYPSGYSPKRNAPDPRKMQHESTIRPEIAKRDQSVPVLRPEDFEDDDDDDDEFEEVFIIVDVQRKPLWRKGLEKPKPQPQKIGKPIQDLLELSPRRVKRESPPDKLATDEKIESLQRTPVVYEGRDLASILQEL